MFNNVFFLKIVPFMRQCGKNMVEPEATDDNRIRCMRFACWITKATNTHSEYAILIAKVVTRTPVIVTLCLHCLSCSYT